MTHETSASKELAWAVTETIDEERNDHSHHHAADGLKTGNKQDGSDMHRLGRRQELKRNFSSYSILGFASIVQLSWPSWVTGSTFVLINGGTAGAVWTLLAVWICMFTVAASLGEMASMAPTSAGQYHWVSEFAPPNCQKFVSYVIAWLSALGWQAATAACCYVTSSLILETASLNHPNYTPTNWQITLLMILIAGTLVWFNVQGARKLPLIEGLLLFLYVFGFFAIIIPLWVLAPKLPAKQVFTEFSNFGDWTSVGGACIVGVLTSSNSMFGTDATAHMAEEIQNASLVIPRTMLGSLALNGCLAFVVMISICFCITDIQVQVADSTATFPFIGIFQDATNSKGGTTAMVVILIVMTWASAVSCLAAGSRQAWSFARDGGLPFSNWLRTVKHMSTPIPLNAILASMAITVIVSLINLGSAEAFNTVVSLGVSTPLLSYSISIACVLLKKIQHPEDLPPARFWMGKWGLPVNAFAVLFTLFLNIMCYFPLSADTTAAYMNYSSVMFAGTVVFAMTFYAFRGRHTYAGPVVLIKRD